MRGTVHHDRACHVPPFPPTAALIPAVPFLAFPPVSPSVIPARLKRESILDQIPKSRVEKPMRLTHIILVLLILAVTSPAFGTALHEAVVKNDIAEVKRLLEAGADVSAKTKHGYTPLHLAAQQGHVASVKVLLQAGADVAPKVISTTARHYTLPQGVAAPPASRRCLRPELIRTSRIKTATRRWPRPPVTTTTPKSSTSSNQPAHYPEARNRAGSPLLSFPHVSSGNPSSTGKEKVPWMPD